MKIVKYSSICDSKLKLLVIESIAVCNYKVINNTVIITLTWLQEKTCIILSNNDYKKFYNDLIGLNSFENTMDFLFERIKNPSNNDLVKELKKYKKLLVKGKNLNHKYVLKLYSEKELKSSIRDEHNVSWIDYESQLKTSNTIKDRKHGLGIWSFPIFIIENCLNEDCFKNYGMKLLVLQPINNCMYFDNGKEIIGKKYKVVEKLEATDSNILQKLEKYIY